MRHPDPGCGLAAPEFPLNLNCSLFLSRKVMRVRLSSRQRQQRLNGKDYTRKKQFNDPDTALSAVDRQSSQQNKKCEDLPDFSEMGRSNQEYFLKLEELKSAHLETMAKLEKMYQNKLHLKGVLPGACGNTLSSMLRSLWEESAFQPTSLPHSPCELDCSQTSSSESENELLYQEEDNNSEVNFLASAKEQIRNMWDDFNVEDYGPFDSHQVQKLQKSKSKPKKWVPRITVPEPFQMTIREDRKKEQRVRAKAEAERTSTLMRKQEEEEEEAAECQKKFRANPTPAFVFLPLYRELLERNEERRRFIKEKSKEILLASQKPFDFVVREEQKKEFQRLQSEVPSKSKTQVKSFKAKPVPKSVYSSAVTDRIKEEELYREIRIQMRSQELLQNASLPRSMLARSSPSKRKHRHTKQREELKYKPKVNCRVPDFETLHQKFQKQVLKQKHLKPSTVCEPFDLRTLRIPSNRGRILKDIQADEENLKETRWPYLSPRCKSRMRCSSASPRLGETEEPDPPRANESSRRRQDAIRKHEKERMKEYFQELEEIEEKLKKRPLLFERVAQENARMAAEKHYSTTLQELGLCDEFVASKGQSTRWSEHFRGQEFESSSEDTERDSEKQELWEENCESDLDDQDSQTSG
ncbi:protein FAM161A [Tachyglossus aculeatus]|uniref:protein FAM161A n=1 Tax=Tachyglossus aculeatus TaxID=9261 RepID=UPI0018F6D69C|nr:protein FAM161A [Tachyglossus aculeatus]